MTVGIRLYDFARKEMKLSEEKAKEFVQTIDEFNANRFDDSIATKLFVKEEVGYLKEEINLVKNEVRRVEVSLTKAIFWSGLVQFIAIVGSGLAIFNFAMHK